MLLSPAMNDDEAIIMYGLRRFSKYEGYSYNLKYDGPFADNLFEINRSIMIAIDATDFSTKMTSEVQYMR